MADQWVDPLHGPSLVVVGEVDGDEDQAAWGGGGAGPQNVDVHKAPATWNVGFVLVDTSTARYPATSVSTITSTWLDHFERGVNVGGVTRSVVDYYSEVSYDAFTMQRQGNSCPTRSGSRSFES